MNASRSKLKSRSPLSWLFLSLLVPYAYFYWLHASAGQIGQLNRQQKTGHRIKISPWWATGLFSLVLALGIGLVVVGIVGDIDLDEHDYLTAVPTASAHDSPYHAEEGLYEATWQEGYNGLVYGDEAVDSSGDLAADGSVYADSYSDPVDNYFSQSSSTAADVWFVLIYLALLVAGLAYSIVQFLHLLQHTDGLVKLAGPEADKSFLIVMAAIGCFVTPLLLPAFVYKSQSNLNQLIDPAEPEA